jgi:uncharacterized protein
MSLYKRLPSTLLIAVAIVRVVSAVPANTFDGVRTVDVTFQSLETQLTGKLVLPSQVAKRRFPAVLLIAGSDQGADAKIGIARAPRKAFEELAVELAKKGIASYRYDNRCSGASKCKPDTTLQDHNEDAMAALKMLARRAEIDPARIVAIGHDEGGIFASHVAATATAPTKVIGLVTIGMPGRVYHKILRAQEQRRLVEEGKPAAGVNEYLEQFDRLTLAIMSGSADPTHLRIDRNDPIFKPIIANVPYFFNQFQTDPLQVIRGVQVPVLIVQGEKDAHVEVKDANYLNEMLRGQYNTDFAMKTPAEMDHWMRVQKGPASLTVDEATRPLDPAFLSELSDWLAKRFK